MGNTEFIEKSADFDPRLFESREVSSLGVGQRNTISNGPDDGTLNKLAAVFWNSQRHGTSTELVDNLVNTANATICNICGHGNVGFFESGAGQQLPYAPDLYVFGWNKDVWIPRFQRLRGLYIQMTIWACETGQGQDGADLLFLLAQASDCAVRATNGLVTTNGNGVWLQAGAVWVTATPTQAPTPVGPPPHLAVLGTGDFISVGTQDGYMKISPSSVAEIRLERFSLLSKHSTTEVMVGDEARAFAWRLFGSEPFRVPGTPSAMITAKAVIKLLVPGKHAPETHKFVIYNDRLVVDVTSGDAYYARPGSAIAL